MRCVLLLIATSVAAPPAARADVRLGAGVGAGGQGDSTYGAVDLRLDAEWTGWNTRLGLGARGIWLDGVFRRADWSEPLDALRAVRLLEMSATSGETRVGLAGGGLAPAQLAHVASGYRAALDDRARTGVRGALTSAAVALTLELDDVIEPGFGGGALAWRASERWILSGATAIDPQARELAIELALARRWELTRGRVDLGAGVVGEPGHGLAALAFAETTIERGGMRWIASAELRGGTGTVGAAFGPLHRIERGLLYAEAHAGVGAALAFGVVADAGWVRAEARSRPDFGTLVTASAAAPMGRWMQAGAWVAASRHAAAGAGELRVAWAKRLASTLELARMYDPEAATDAMTRAPTWSLTAWFSATTN